LTPTMGSPESKITLTPTTDQEQESTLTATSTPSRSASPSHTPIYASTPTYTNTPTHSTNLTSTSSPTSGSQASALSPTPDGPRSSTETGWVIGYLILPIGLLLGIFLWWRSRKAEKI
jgi:hypothetical protein